MTTPGTLHHVEVWVADLAEAQRSLGWLLSALGYQPRDTWPQGSSWVHGASYIVIESGPDVRGEHHDRRRPGVNHLAFHAGSESDVDGLTQESRRHGWSLLFADRHPHAGGPHHYAAYLENRDGFEVELVASA
ncbi:VOC family protein [Cellulomonas cellasea]|uniref:VOC family protein n=1 Tax=Cellulomonas cellasea TaxID=43670 RepID=UPI0025A3334F|nr:VOC family protein [Cellulomonas cellasea]MDM8084519.1 VOC family protein [Cellulomonas cellasea]